MKKHRGKFTYLALLIAGFLLFVLASRSAEAERGYKAIGGEAFFVLLPLIYYLVKDTAREVKDAIERIGRDE